MFPSLWLSAITGWAGHQRPQKKSRRPQFLKLNVETLETRVTPSHFRGAAMVPQVDATGLLTVTSTSFWRNGAANSLSPAVSGPNINTGMTFVSSVDDTSDSRFTKRVNVHTAQLPNAGLFQIDDGSCCRVSGIINAGEDDWDMTSKINWNGISVTKPITFDFSAVQSEVVRGENYVGNLSAIPKSGVTLTYNQALNTSINSQPPGFVINPTTGALFIPAADTTTYGDNGNNVGADYAFSGNIFASDGSQIEFDWLFDAVAVASNRTPTVNDSVINSAVGNTINKTVTGTDPDGDTLTWTFISLSGPNGATPPIAPTFNPATQKFVWNSTGAAPGTWLALVRAADPGGRTDIGTITINLKPNVDLTGRFKVSSFFFNQIKPTGRITVGYINLTNIGANITGDFTVSFPVADLKVTAFRATRPVKASGYQQDGRYFITFQGGLNKGQSLGIYVQFDKVPALSLDEFRKKLRIFIFSGGAEA